VITVRGLQNAQQGLDVKGIGDDGELPNGPLQTVSPKQPGGAEYGETVEAAVPKAFVVRQLLKRLEEWPNVPGRVLLPERFAEGPDEVPKPDRILLLVRVRPMGRLGEGKARRLDVIEETAGIVLGK
jgi:hypothetical protein